MESKAFSICVTLFDNRVGESYPSVCYVVNDEASIDRKNLGWGWGGRIRGGPIKGCIGSYLVIIHV